jgi:hypothetical protein
MLCPANILGVTSTARLEVLGRGLVPDSDWPPHQVACHSEWSVPRLCFCAKRRDTQSRNLSSV